MSCELYKTTCPLPGDQPPNLLGKILQVLNNTSGGGGGGGVTSVNGDTGPAVTLTTDNVPEASSLYFTEARVRASVLTGLVSALGAITAADSVLSAFGKTQGRLAALEAGTAGPFLLKAGDTGTGPFVFTPSASNTTPLTLSGASLTGATAIPFLSIAGTWNTTGAPTGLFFNATNTASNSGSMLFDFQLSASSLLSLRVDGLLSLAGRASFITTSALGHVFRVSDALSTSMPLVATLSHTLSAGVGGVGMGATLDWTLDSTTTQNTRAARWSTAWTVATHATRTAYTSFLSFSGGSEVTNMLLGGGQVLLNTGTLAVPASADRNNTDLGWYFPSDTGIAASIDGVQKALINATGVEVVAGRLKTAVANLSDAATIATDVALANHFRVTLGGNRTLGAPTNAYDGARVVWEFTQDGAGNRTLAYDAIFAFGTDIASATLSTTAGKTDFLTAIYDSTAVKWRVVAFVTGY